MNGGYAKVLRYSRAWAKGTDHVRQVECTYEKDGEPIPGTLFIPRAATADLPAPAWVVLHGVTVPGRKHESLIRFARALASTPAVVFTPEVPAWTALQLDPALTTPTIEAAVLALDQCEEADSARTGLLGFSFGAPQALAASTNPALRERLHTVVGFGGYCDLSRTLRYLFTGLHEWDGEQRYRRPDPYGRWIVGANFLEHVEGFEGSAPLARTLNQLATQAGKRRIASWDPMYDNYKADLRAALPHDLRGAFDVFAPPADVRPDVGEATELADRIGAAVERVSPGLADRGWVDHVTHPVHLIHGRDDPLIPFTETRRMAALLRGGDPSREIFDTVTPLFAHSSEHSGLGVLDRVRENLTLARALARILASV